MATAGVTGNILTNGYPRQMKVFNKLSSYIMQDDVLQPNLKVRECLLIAAHLKLGNELSNEDKDAAVDEILATLGLTKCANTFLEQLSGGQRKRVAVAQELVNNPPVIFLDEPTTGLDVVSINQCVLLLKRLSRQGRTIICTIHQPSAMLFHQFDHVYMVARGRCVYQGSSNQVVPFLNDCSLHCPSTYNPADYAIEVLNNETINVLSTEIQNGRINRRDPCCEQTDSVNRICSNDEAPYIMFESSDHTRHIQFPTSFWVQFCIILKRMMLQKARNKFGLYLQIIHHIFSGFIVGVIFHGIGDNASRPFDNFKLIICVNVFFMYTHCMTPILTFPIEKKVMRREFFNRWYSLKAYYLALSLSTIPLIVTLGLVFNTISYTMSDLPMEWERFLWFNVMTILTGLIAEGQGILIGFTFNPTNGVVAGPSTMSVILMLSLHGMGYGMHIVQLMRYVMNLSYLRFSLVGMVTALFLNGRKEMTCKEANFLEYCHYKDPRLLVEDMGMEGQETATQLIGLFAYLLLFRVAAYLSLRLSLTTEVSNRVLSFFRKIIKGKEL